MVFIDYLLRPEIAKKNMAYLFYPFPVRDAAPAFADLVKDVPAADVDLADLENPDVFRLLGADEVQRRAAAWTEVKAS
jgi:spermidine/putrescine transport system substrate-binding protein